jgi:cytochrome c oxidase subunit 2
MRIRLVAETENELSAWATGQQAPAPVSQDALAVRGYQVLASSTCINCHTISGTGAVGRVGPDLTHLASRATLGGGVAELTPVALQQWIRDPQSLKPGVLMPAYGNLTPDDLAALAAYLESLK